MNFNPFDMLKNADAFQAQIDKIKDELAELVRTGEAGGGIVKVSMNGKMEIVDVQIDPIAVDPRDVKMLQDLIVAASCSAYEKIKEESQSKLGNFDFSKLGL